MQLIKNEELNINKWRVLIKLSRYYSPFQTPEFYKSLNSIEEFSTDVFAVEEDDAYKSLVLVTVQKEKGIRGFFSIRGIVHGGPLLIESGNIFLECLLKEVKSFYKKKLIYLEIRNNFDYCTSLETYKKAGWKFHNHLNVQLNVEDANIESILSGMTYNRRREIRLSIKEGVVTRLANNDREVVLLYKILKDMYLKRVKLPLNPLSFFLNLYKSDIGKIFIVFHNDKIIGGSFCIYYKNMTIYTLYYTGLRAYHKKIFPTHLAIYSIIEFAIKENLKMVDFMGAGKPDTEYGVRDYKLQFGGDLVDFGRFNIIFKPLLFNLGIWGLKKGLAIKGKV